ncbi:MAG: hypothetical protein A3F90_16135 [Deltaproteobacteria bacterium RIFCSPLOWO2_12_FULL_60_19]|nr:MAG: hypothetical protein A3F90_16135 [Deltaproteobacteria bacterium RIFCSPLOWO2_12_FULL_60_19]
MICIDKTVQCYPHFNESKLFAVNMLGEEQEELSRRFATKGIEKFNGIPWRKGESGLALLEGAISHIECRVVHAYDGGDHTIYVGQILSASASGDRPLMFFQGKYHRLPK